MMSVLRYGYGAAGLAVCFQFFLLSDAHADFYKGTDLKFAINGCQTPKNIIRAKEIIDCYKAIGYIAGIADARNNQELCMDDKVTAATLSGYFVAYMDLYPEIAHKDASDIIIKSIAAKFPCLKGHRK